MGFFDRFRKREQADPGAVLEIAGCISGGHADVTAEVRALAADTAGYFAAHREDFAERGVEDCGSPQEIRLLGMVDILERHGFVCERDCKDELEDFLAFAGALAGVQQMQLPLSSEHLDEDDCIPSWCAELDAAWEHLGACMACIDIGSDSYVLFPAKTADLPRLRTLAAGGGYRIGLAREM